MASPSETVAVETAVADLVGEYDRRWSCVDLAGVAGLWERQAPAPIYVGDEYAAPLIGHDQLDRHWGRLSGRVESASVSSTLHAFDVVDNVVRAVLLSRWRLTDRHAGTVRTGASWITWLLVRRGARYRIVHHMESQVHLSDDEGT